jgi:hypothetical protein
MTLILRIRMSALLIYTEPKVCSWDSALPLRERFCREARVHLVCKY